MDYIETLEAKIKLLEDQLEERTNDELDLQQRLNATLQEIEFFQTVSAYYTRRVIEGIVRSSRPHSRCVN